jgi:hypothetical protein
MEDNLSLQHAQILAAMPKIRCVDFSESATSCIEPEAAEHLQQQNLIPEEELLLALPRT